MSMTGGYMSMAEACGEAEPTGLAFFPGDFDPNDDPEETREIVKLAMDRDMADRLHASERTNELLRQDLYRMQERMGEGDPEGGDFGDWRMPCCGADYDCICD